MQSGFNDLKALFERNLITVEVQKDPNHWKLRYVGSRYAGIVVAYWPTTGRAYVFGKSFVPKSPESLIRAIVTGRIKMPSEASTSVCKTCQEPIWWVTTDKGKKMPLEASGEAHWSNCPQADHHRVPNRATA